MSTEFGTRVKFGSVLAKRRRFMVGRSDREPVCEWRMVETVPGERPTHEWESPAKFDGLEVVCETTPPVPNTFGWQSNYTLVDLVKWPLESPREGVVIGASHRHAGFVQPGDYGNIWTSRGATPYVAVAVDTEMAQPLVYDVHPDDLEFAEADRLNGGAA